MDDLISRQAAIDALDGEIEITGRTNAEAVKGYVRLVKDRLERLPSAEPQRKKGEWTEKTVIENPQAAGIDEWQSCKCSNCGRYDTRPYKYYFNEPRYCSWCGADMRGEQDG